MIVDLFLTQWTKAINVIKHPLRSLFPRDTDCFYVTRAGERLPLAEPIWCEPSDDKKNPSPLMLTDLPGITRMDIDNKKRSLWRYAASFPFVCAAPISLGEGCTPLVQRPFGGTANVHFKCEWYNPTCSFKDRGTTVMLSLLKQQVRSLQSAPESAPSYPYVSLSTALDCSFPLPAMWPQGITKVLEDSSGNGGASVSCYAAAGGLTATIMAPESTAPAKTVQMRAHGATVELIPGSRQDCADAAVG